MASFHVPRPMGLAGQYEITRLGRSDSLGFFRRAAGRMRDGMIEVGPLGQYEVRGYKLDRIPSRSP